MAAPRKKRFILVVVVLAILGGITAWQWYPIRVKMILAGSGTDEEKTKALGDLGTPAIPALIGSYQSVGGSWEDKVLVGMLLVREPYRRVTVLEQGLDAENKTVRRVSTSLLLGTRNVDERARIVESLKDWAADPDFGYRVPLADAAAELNGPETIPILIGLLGDQERARRARLNSADYLGVLFRDDPAIIEPLVAAARTDPSELVRARAVQSLGRAGWSEDMSVYADLLSAEDKRARQMTALGLKTLPPEKTEDLLVRLLADPVQVVRRAALKNLVENESSVVVEQAEFLMEDSYMGVRGDLAQGIGNLGEKRLVPVLLRGLLDEEPDDGFNVIQKSIWALHQLTGNHHGFPDEPFLRARWDPALLRPAARAWVETPAGERARVMKLWHDEFGDYDRRPGLLRQLRHADPANVARAVRELTALEPGKATPGFDADAVKGAAGAVDPDSAAFQALVESAVKFQALEDEKREAHWAEWEAEYGG